MTGIDSSSTVTAATVQSVSPAAPRENMARAKERVVPPAPTVAPARETQVHIGRVELLVSASSPPTSPKAIVPKARGPRAPSAPHGGFSLHRHYLRST